MALICKYGGECTGCMMCEKEREEACRCSICGSAVYFGDEAVSTDDGMICLNDECIGEYVKNNAEKSDVADYVNDFADDFVDEHKWELIELAMGNDEVWQKLTDKFISDDLKSFSSWWLEKKNLCADVC